MNTIRRSQKIFTTSFIFLFILSLDISFGQDENNIQVLLTQLKDENLLQRIKAAEQLGELGDRRAVEPLIECLNNKSMQNMSARRAAIEALGLLKDPRAVKPLITCLENENPHFLEPNIIKALGKIGDKHATKPLSDYLVASRIGPEKNKQVTLQALGQLGDPNAIDSIVTFLETNRVSPSITSTAIDTIIKLDSQVGSSRVIDLWRNSEPSLRSLLNNQLVRTGKPVVRPLVDLLVEMKLQVNKNGISYLQRRARIINENDMVKNAIEILSEIGDPQAVPAIIDHLRSDEMSIRKAAEQALLKLNKASVEFLIVFLEKRVSKSDRFDSARQRGAAIRILGEIGDSRAVDVLIQCLKGNDYSEKKAAANALMQIGDHRAIPHLKALLKDKRQEIRKTAADALVSLGYKEQREAAQINFLLAQEDWSELARMGKPAVTPLIKYLANTNVISATSAQDCLVEIGESAVLPLIAYLKRNLPEKVNRTNASGRIRRGMRRFPRNRLNTMRSNTQGSGPQGYTNPVVAVYVVQALGRIGDPRAIEPLVEYLDRFGKNCPFPVILALAQLGDHRAVEPLLAQLDDTDLGALSAMTLVDLMGEKALRHIIPRLPQWGAHRGLISALLKLGWKPESEAEMVYVWTATNNKDELLSHWQQTKRVLLPDLKHKYKARSAANVFLMFKKDDPAVVNGLLGLIRIPSSESYARDLLLCRHHRLVNAAANWLEANGHEVFITYTETESNYFVKEERYYKKTTPPDRWQELLRKMHDWK